MSGDSDKITFRWDQDVLCVPWEATAVLEDGSKIEGPAFLMSPPRISLVDEGSDHAL